MAFDGSERARIADFRPSRVGRGRGQGVMELNEGADVAEYLPLLFFREFVFPCRHRRSRSSIGNDLEEVFVGLGRRGGRHQIPGTWR
jgi:hypothetical protein